VQAIVQIAAFRYSTGSVFYFADQISVLIGNPGVADCIDLLLRQFAGGNDSAVAALDGGRCGDGPGYRPIPDFAITQVRICGGKFFTNEAILPVDPRTQLRSRWHRACARNVTNSDWVCQDRALVSLGRGRQDAASD